MKKVIENMKNIPLAWALFGACLIANWKIMLLIYFFTVLILWILKKKKLDHPFLEENYITPIINSYILVFIIIGYIFK